MAGQHHKKLLHHILCKEQKWNQVIKYVTSSILTGQEVNTTSYYMASSASGQNSVFWLATRAGKMERYCPPRTARFVPANKISPMFKRVHGSFLSPKIFSAKVKGFFVLSLSLWNQKKRQREWKQRKQKCWWVLKIHFATKTGKHKSLFWTWKFEFEIWIWNKTNQMIVLSAFIQSGYRGTRHHFSI